MHYTLNTLAEGQFLNKELLKLYVEVRSRRFITENFWHLSRLTANYTREAINALDYLDQFETDTWHTEELIKDFKEFCEPKNLIKEVILSESKQQDFDLTSHIDKLDTQIEKIISILGLKNNSRQIYSNI